MNSINILLLEDNPAEARLLQEFLKEAKSVKFALVHVKRLREALHRLNQYQSMSCPYDLILLDLGLPDSQGLTSLEQLLEQAPQLPIIVLTNAKDNELAVEGVRQGARDYLVKRQLNRELLVSSIQNAIDRKQTEDIQNCQEH